MNTAELAQLSDDEIRARLIARGRDDIQIDTLIRYRDTDPDINRALRYALDTPAGRGAAIHHAACEEGTLS